MEQEKIYIQDDVISSGITQEYYKLISYKCANQYILTNGDTTNDYFLAMDPCEREVQYRFYSNGAFTFLKGVNGCATGSSDAGYWSISSNVLVLEDYQNDPNKDSLFIELKNDSLFKLIAKAKIFPFQYTDTLVLRKQG